MDVAQLLTRAVFMYPHRKAIIDEEGVSLNYSEFEIMVKKAAVGLKKTFATGEKLQFFPTIALIFLLLYSMKILKIKSKIFSF